MGRIEEATERYLTSWNDNYALVNDRGIVTWQVRNVMADIECWIEGSDPNGAKESAGVEDWSRDEFIELYESLSATAAFFDYTVRRYRSSDGPP